MLAVLKLFNVVQLVLWSPVSDVECPLSVTDSGIPGWSVETLAAERCRPLHVMPDMIRWYFFEFIAFPVPESL